MDFFAEFPRAELNLIDNEAISMTFSILLTLLLNLYKTWHYSFRSRSKCPTLIICLFTIFLLRTGYFQRGGPNRRFGTAVVPRAQGPNLPSGWKCNCNNLVLKFLPTEIIAYAICHSPRFIQNLNCENDLHVYLIARHIVWIASF